MKKYILLTTLLLGTATCSYAAAVEANPDGGATYDFLSPSLKAGYRKPIIVILDEGRAPHKERAAVRGEGGGANGYTLSYLYDDTKEVSNELHNLYEGERQIRAAVFEARAHSEETRALTGRMLEERLAEERAAHARTLALVEGLSHSLVRAEAAIADLSGRLDVTLGRLTAVEARGPARAPSAPRERPARAGDAAGGAGAR